MALQRLVAWIGRQDLEGSQREQPTGPIVDFLRVHPEVRAVLLSDWPKEKVTPYLASVRRATKASIDIRPIKLKDPTHYLGILRAADAVLAELASQVPLDQIAIHTSPGTSPMSAVWVLLAKTKYPGTKLFKSWVDQEERPHLAEVEIPFELTLDVLPDIAERHARLLAPSDTALPVTGAFDAIIHRSAALVAVIRDARRAAVYPNPVLIVGESGTGKELFAHRASPARVWRCEGARRETPRHGQPPGTGASPPQVGHRSLSAGTPAALCGL